MQCVAFRLKTTPLKLPFCHCMTISSHQQVSCLCFLDLSAAFDTLNTFVPKDFPFVINQLQSSVSTISSWMTANLITLNPSKTEFMLIGLPQQLSKIHFPSLSLPPAQPILPCSPASNLCSVFDSSLSFNQQISKLSSSCHYHIRDLRGIRNSLDHKTAATIATSLVHSRLDYCNSLYYSLPASQLHCLQLIQNALAIAVSRTPLHSSISPVLHSLHWFKIDQRIQYKIISITHNLLHSVTPSYLYRLLNIQPTHPTRSSNCLCQAHPKLTSRLKFSNRSFHNAAPSFWNKLPTTIRSLSTEAIHANPVPFPPLALSHQQFLE